MTDDKMIEFFASIPFVGERKLSPVEMAQIKHRILKSVSFVLVLSIVNIAILILLPNILEVYAPYSYQRFMAFGAFILLFCFTIYIGAARQRYNRVFKRALTTGFVKVFAGEFGYATPNTCRLIRTLHDVNDESVNIFEIFTDDDVLYSINGVIANGYYEVELTCAAPVPVDPPVFSVPEDWIEASVGEQIERRRLSPAEACEIEEFASLIRKGNRQLYFVYMIPVFLIIMLVSKECFGASIYLQLVAAMIITSLIYIILLNKASVDSRSFFTDLDVGWVIISNHDDGIDGEQVVVEYLAGSGRLWSINNLPSPWRQNRKLRKSLSLLNL